MESVLEPRNFANLSSVAGLSRTTLDEHHQLYCGYVRKANALSDRLVAIQNTPHLANSVDIVNIKGELVVLFVKPASFPDQDLCKVSINPPIPVFIGFGQCRTRNWLFYARVIKLTGKCSQA